jgi:peptidoglycan/xylan/chitin deacetylase (PgdA/CDA1 family)
MIKRLTIVMYHYVRDVESTPYPGIKALPVKAFCGQLEYIRRFYTVVSGAELLEAIREESYTLPPNAALLTFDDGYADHFTTVLPILEEFGFTGVFSPVAKSILEGHVLDVNKIHFVLSATSDNVGRVVDTLFALLDHHRAEYGLESNESYYSRLAVASRFDPPEIIFIKRLLQRELPEPLRGRIVEELFHRYVTTDERSFAAELYMSLDQLRTMAVRGMTLASHSYDHYWLGTLPPHRQSEEIDRSLDFLRKLQPVDTGWIMCYPYGSYNESLLSTLREKNCLAGFTTEVDLVSPGGNPLLLPRLDTNDLPKAGEDEANEWTKKAMQ